MIRKLLKVLVWFVAIGVLTYVALIILANVGIDPVLHTDWPFVTLKCY